MNIVIVFRWAGEPALAEGRVFLFNGEVNEGTHLSIPLSPFELTPTG